MGLKLFDSDVDDDNEDISKIEINSDFTRRYEHNKKREDLQRLEELKNKGHIDDSSDSDSESLDEVDEDHLSDAKFVDILIRVKNQDPSLKLTEANLDEKGDSDVGGGDHRKDDDKYDIEKKVHKKEKTNKPLYLKDVVAKQLLEDSIPDLKHKSEGNKLKNYAEEQEELRKKIYDGGSEAEEGDGQLLQVKRRKGGDGDDDNPMHGEDVEFQKKLDEYFGRSEELDENSMFLKGYISNKMWVDKDDLNKDLEDLSQDEEDLEKQEEYEREYNFRYEEGVGDQVLGHARFVEGTVRKKPSARKLQREKRKERMKQAEFERKEELKRLKNLKMDEIIKKRNKINEIAGIRGDLSCTFNADDLEGDFNPEEHDRKMKELFDETYYGEDDADPEFVQARDGLDGGDLEKPIFEKEDELLGIPKDWHVCPSGKDFLGERQRILKQVDVESKKQKDGEENDGQKRRGNELGVEELEEIYKLDYEDTIGDMKTRFKYAKVNTNRFGLKPEELLLMEDDELNQYVSLKKIAPYRDAEWKVSNSKRFEQKMKNIPLLKGVNVQSQKVGKKKRSLEHKKSTINGMEEGFVNLADSNGDDGNASRRSTKKQRKEELKLSLSRLISYGKIPYIPKSKNKAKN